jgi:hypothetical protein
MLARPRADVVVVAMVRNRGEGAAPTALANTNK